MASYESEYTPKEWEQINVEFQRLKGQHYLDHAGTTLYSERQLHDITADLCTNLYSNPHTSKSTEDLIDQVRFQVLQHFHTNADDYHVVFTAGATASLKTVAECFDFGDDGEFVYTLDNHTSVLGMRSLVHCAQIRGIGQKELQTITSAQQANSLLVFAGQCNFSGFKPATASTVANYQLTGGYVCLDAASLAATSVLDLSQCRADFVCMSFYKMFGYPTGLGALLVSRRGADRLDKRYYGGGTVKIALAATTNWHRKRDKFHERFEDGTIPFLSIISLLSGFKTLSRLVPERDGRSTMKRIQSHTFGLAKYLVDNLRLLRYTNGRAAVKLNCDSGFIEERTQGGIVTFNLRNADGSFIGFAEVADVASIFNVTLRTGCFCNPGACQRHLKLSNEELKAHFKAGHVCGDSVDLIDGIPTGSVRISVGYMTTQADIDVVIQMIRQTYLMTQHKQSLTPVTISDSTHHQHDHCRSNVRLTEICVYPVKSCGAFKVKTRWPITQRGLKYDREWMIVKSNGVCVTQKTNTRLCMIRPIIDERAGVLELHFPNEPMVKVQLKSDENERNTLAQLCQSKVCGDRIQGIDCGDDVAEWLSNVLYMCDLRLIRQSSMDGRTLNENIHKDAPSISLANQAQYLLINETSVEWLVRRVADWSDKGGSHLDRLSNAIDRFRGNFIVRGASAFDENNWTAIHFGRQFRLTAIGQCTRCQMICIDQSSGEKTTEPLRTISHEFRGKVKFGIYLMGGGGTSLSAMQDDDNETIYVNCDENVFIE